MEPVIELPPEAEAASPSARFGRFIRTECVGRGGMGEVWRAWDPALGRWVALKFLTVKDDRDREWFRREAHLAATLDHPNIAATHDVGEDQGRLYIAMQFIDGLPLDRIGAVSPRMAAEIVRDAARGVAHAHAQGIIHRDLKPGNFMMTPEGRVYVTDFGLAKRLIEAGAITKHGEAAGTPGYMSPEALRAQPLDARSDVYALGATLRELAPRAPKALRRIIAKCIQREPVDRYAHAGELADALDGWLEPRPARRYIVAGLFCAVLAFGVLLIPRAAIQAPAGPSIRPEVDRLYAACYQHWRDGRYVEMERDASEAIRLAPRNWVGWQLRAMGRMQAGRMDPARADIEEVLVLEPDRPEGYTLLGQWKLKGKEFDGAIMEFTRAVELAGTDKGARENAIEWRAVARTRKLEAGK